MDIASIGLQGMQAAESRVIQAASRIAQTRPLMNDEVDLSAEMVALIAARDRFQSSTKLIAAGDELARATIDLLG